MQSLKYRPRYLEPVVSEVSGLVSGQWVILVEQVTVELQRVSGLVFWIKRNVADQSRYLAVCRLQMTSANVEY